ncbi:MAG: FAD-dependent oxidoreductase, partial [Chloroflexota bacterium]
MTNSQQAILVVGAGIYGVTAALELRRRGYAVTLCDPGPLPHPHAASTDITKVIRMDYGADELYMTLMEEAFVGWDAWNRAWPEPLYHETGYVVMAHEAMRPGTYEYDSYAMLLKRGHKPQRLNAHTLKEKFPAWNADRYADGYYNPRAGWAASGKVVARLIGEAQAAGVVLR